MDADEFQPDDYAIDAITVNVACINAAVQKSASFIGVRSGRNQDVQYNARNAEQRRSAHRIVVGS